MRTALTICLFLVSSSSAVGQLIISEVLANEPSNRVLLEWVELYNSSALPCDLGDFLLVNDEDTLSLSSGTTVSGGLYVVLCRRLEPLGTSDCFEYHWGDSSGVWGDSPCEEYLALNVTGLLLNNSRGDLKLLDKRRGVVDACAWFSSAGDGQSLERDDLNDWNSGWHPCNDPLGSTPGRPNSSSPAIVDEYLLEVRPIYVRRGDAAATFAISYSFPHGAVVSASIFDDAGRQRACLLGQSRLNAGSINWPATDDKGQPLPAGLYLLLFEVSGTYRLTKSLPLLVVP